MEQSTDEKLMVQFQKGDAQAFEQLLKRHRRGVFGFVLRYTNDSHTAEELLQEVFLRVVRNACSFERRSKFTTWLYSIARNLCIDHLRRMRHRKTTSLDRPAEGEADGLTLLDKVESNAPGPDKESQRTQIRQHLQQAILELHPLQREVLLMREEAGLQFEEIARIVDAPVNTIKSRMRYALQNLKTLLQAQGIEP